MGCDIHLCAEVKINGEWHLYDQPRIDRNYLLFERMAGVRGEKANAIAVPRGLPADMSKMTDFLADSWGSDGHSHSWLTAQEIAELADWGKKNLGPGRRSGFSAWDMEWDWGSYLLGNSYSGFVRYPNDRPKGIEDVRFVFWFDN